MLASNCTTANLSAPRGSNCEAVAGMPLAQTEGRAINIIYPRNPQLSEKSRQICSGGIMLYDCSRSDKY